MRIGKMLNEWFGRWELTRFVSFAFIGFSYFKLIICAESPHYIFNSIFTSDFTIIQIYWVWPLCKDRKKFSRLYQHPELLGWRILYVDKGYLGSLKRYIRRRESYCWCQLPELLGLPGFSDKKLWPPEVGHSIRFIGCLQGLRYNRGVWNWHWAWRREGPK